LLSVLLGMDTRTKEADKEAKVAAANALADKEAKVAAAKALADKVAADKAAADAKAAITKTKTIADFPPDIRNKLSPPNDYEYIGTYTTANVVTPATLPEKTNTVGVAIPTGIVTNGPTSPEIVSTTHLFWNKETNNFHSITENPVSPPAAPPPVVIS